jgi:nucleotide-binding universal stress UspA family protein
MGTVGSTICDYLSKCISEDEFINFVVVGNTGADYLSHDDKGYMGSVARAVIEKTRINTLFFP